MILTITPNPSLDYLFEAETLCWDDANRVEMPRRRAGGQGINLTRAARVLGGESVALGLLGGSAGEEIKRLLSQEGTPFIDVSIAAETRVFFGVRETTTGRSMLVNPRGPVLTNIERDALLSAVAQACEELKPRWVVGAGSIPRGLGNDLYARIAAIANATGASFVADCDGAALASAVAAGCALIAPNKHEAQRLTYTSMDTLEDALAGARALRSTAPNVLIKLGEAGAVAASEEGCWLARGPRMQSGSAVGAGDAFLAAMLVAKENGAPLNEALRSAVAAGTAVLLSRGSDLLSYSDYLDILPDVNVTAY